MQNFEVKVKQILIKRSAFCLSTVNLGSRGKR